MGFIGLGDQPAAAVSSHRLRRAQVRHSAKGRVPRAHGPDVAAMGLASKMGELPLTGE
jgi:hypothetical protein